MSYAGGQYPDTFELLGLAHRLLELTAVGKVAHHFGIPAQPAVLPERDHHARGPEAAAVLSQVPALILGSTLLSGGLQLYFGNTGVSVRRNEDLMGGSTLHLLWGESEQLFRAVAPAAYPSIRVEKNDPIVLGRGEEEIHQIVRHIPSGQQ